MIFHRWCDAEEGLCLHRKLDAGKATENNLQGSRAARKVGYARWDDQPGSNPFDLRIVVALGDAILESRRFAQMQAVPRDVPPTRTFEDHDRARHYESPAMSQFGNSGDKIAQTVAVARYILQQGFFSAT